MRFLFFVCFLLFVFVFNFFINAFFYKPYNTFLPCKKTSTTQKKKTLTHSTSFPFNQSTFLFFFFFCGDFVGGGDEKRFGCWCVSSRERQKSFAFSFFFKQKKTSFFSDVLGMDSKKKKF